MRTLKPPMTPRIECNLSTQDDLTVDDLYKIYAWDEKWMRLSRRKMKLKNLMMKVQQYQFERTKESAYIRTERILEAEDIDRYLSPYTDIHSYRQVKPYIVPREGRQNNTTKLHGKKRRRVNHYSHLGSIRSKDQTLVNRGTVNDGLTVCRSVL